MYLVNDNNGLVTYNSVVTGNLTCTVYYSDKIPSESCGTSGSGVGSITSTVSKDGKSFSETLNTYTFSSTDMSTVFSSFNGQMTVTNNFGTAVYKGYEYASTITCANNVSNPTIVQLCNDIQANRCSNLVVQYLNYDSNVKTAIGAITSCVDFDASPYNQGNWGNAAIAGPGGGYGGGGGYGAP